MFERVVQKWRKTGQFCAGRQILECVTSHFDKYRLFRDGWELGEVVGSLYDL